MILAVLQRSCGLASHQHDVYAATVGGAKLTDPAADLATAIALASAATDIVVPTDMVALGEVGLAGEVRRVGEVSNRLREAARLGFRHALVPADPSPAPAAPGTTDGLRVVAVHDVNEALAVLGLTQHRSRTGPEFSGPRSA